MHSILSIVPTLKDAVKNAAPNFPELLPFLGKDLRKLAKPTDKKRFQCYTNTSV